MAYSFCEFLNRLAIESFVSSDVEDKDSSILRGRHNWQIFSSFSSCCALCLCSCVFSCDTVRESIASLSSPGRRSPSVNGEELGDNVRIYWRIF